MKEKICFLLLFVASICHSQNKIQSQKPDELTPNRNEIFLINNNDEYVFLQKSKANLYTTIFNNEFIPIKKIELIDVIDHRQEILETYYFDQELILIASNTNKDRIGFVTIDLENNKKKSEYNLPKLKSEELLQTYFYNGSCYILSISTNSQEMFLRNISSSGLMETKTFDLSNYKFQTNSSKDERLKYLFRYKGIPTMDTHVVKLNDIFPYTLLQTASKSKTYQIDQKVLLTLDKDVSKTSILEIDLKNMSLKLKEVQKPEFTKGKSGNSNSLIYKNFIYQIVIDKNEMIFDVKDLRTLKSVYNYRVNDEETLKIKNSPIILEGAAYSKERELDHTSQFLKKVSKSNPAIAVNQNRNNSQVTLGASIQMASGLSDFGNGMHIMHFRSIPATLSTDENARSTFIECLFDEKFNHLVGKIEPTVHERIENYKNNNQIESNVLETIAEFENGYIYVVLNNDKFQFIQFN